MSEVDICALDDIIPFGGVAALVDNEQVAIFRVNDDVFALSNHDPFSDANVLSRGIVCSIDDIAAIASPIYKQHFALETGQCLEDDSVSLKTWPARAENGRVIISAQS